VDIYERLQLCAVKIGRPTAAQQGTGFFVLPGLLLTCRHVVVGADGRPLANIPIRTSLGKEINVRDCKISATPDPDLALLSVDLRDHACVLLDRTVNPDSPLFGYGFPATSAIVRGEPVTGKAEGWRVEQTGQAEQRLLKFKEGQILPGMSGAPLLNQDTQRVCAVLKRTRDERSALGGLGIPISAAFELFPDLEERHREYHARDQSWFDAVTALADGPRRGVVRRKVVVDEVDRLADDLAAVTKWVIEEYEKLPGEEIRELVADPARRTTSDGSHDSRLTDQAGALKQIVNAIATRSPPTVAIGGVSGVGKSAVMRRAGLHAADVFLNRARSSGDGGDNAAPPPLPIVINLTRVTPRRGKVSVGSAIVQWWLQYASRQISNFYRLNGWDPPAKITLSELKKLRGRYDLVGILDSADEFLERNLQFEESDLVDWIRHSADFGTKRASPFSQVFVARRSSDGVGGLLAEACARDIYIVRLSEVAAKEMLPQGLWERLTGALDDDARDLLRTPFVSTLFRDYGDKRLRVLAAEPRLERIFNVERDDWNAAPPGALIEFAMRCYLWRDDSEVGPPNVDIPSLIGCAAKIALILFSNMRKEMTLDELRRGSEKFPYISLEGVDDELETLCRRGILHSRTGNKREALIGFSHRIWLDFALAYLIALRLMDGKADILAGHAYNTMIFRDIGYFINSNAAQLGPVLVEGVLDIGDQFAFAQLVSILSHSPVAIDDDALRTIGDGLAAQSRLASHVAISAAGSRALARWPGDPMLASVRAAVVGWCDQVKSGDQEFPFVTHSLADCLRAELADGPRDKVDLDTAAFLQGIYPFAHGDDGAHQTNHLQRRSLEASYISVVVKSFQDVFRIIGGAHYALMAASCCASGAGRVETTFELANLLEKRNILIESAYANYSAFTAHRVQVLLECVGATLSSQVGRARPRRSVP
jgi:hypothetical protein